MIRVGQNLWGRYTILASIEQSDQESSFKAQDSIRNGIVIIREIALHAFSGTEQDMIRARLEQMRSIVHPRFLGYEEILEEAGMVFQIAPLPDAEPLSARLTKPARFPWREAAQLIQAIAGCLQKFQEQSLLHGNITSHSLLYNKDNIWITSFSCLLLPPEDPLSDLKSLGLVFHQMLSPLQPSISAASNSYLPHVENLLRQLPENVYKAMYALLNCLINNPMRGGINSSRELITKIDQLLALHPQRELSQKSVPSRQQSLETQSTEELLPRDTMTTPIVIYTEPSNENGTSQADNSRQRINQPTMILNAQAIQTTPDTKVIKKQLKKKPSSKKKQDKPAVTQEQVTTSAPPLATSENKPLPKKADHALHSAHEPAKISIFTVALLIIALLSFVFLGIVIVQTIDKQ